MPNRTFLNPLLLRQTENNQPRAVCATIVFDNIARARVPSRATHEPLIGEESPRMTVEGHRHFTYTALVPRLVRPSTVC